MAYRIYYEIVNRRTCEKLGTFATLADAERALKVMYEEQNADRHLIKIAETLLECDASEGEADKILSDILSGNSNEVISFQKFGNQRIE